MKNWYDELYNKAQDAIARPVHVANPDPLYNKINIEDNGKYDVGNFAVANVNVNGSGGGGSEPTGKLLFPNDTLNFEIWEGNDYAEAWIDGFILDYQSIIVEFDGTRYSLENYDDDNPHMYQFGARNTSLSYDFSEFPLNITYFDEDSGSSIYTENQGNHSIKIWVNSDPVEPTS